MEVISASALASQILDAASDKVAYYAAEWMPPDLTGVTISINMVENGLSDRQFRLHFTLP